MKILIQVTLFIFFIGLFTILGGNILQLENIRITAGETLGWLFFLKILLIFFIIGLISVGTALLIGISKNFKKQKPSKTNDESEDTIPHFTIEGPDEDSKSSQESIIDILTDNKEKVRKMPQGSPRKTTSAKKRKQVKKQNSQKKKKTVPAKKAKK